MKYFISNNNKKVTATTTKQYSAVARVIQVGGARKCWGREPLGGSGGMLPQKNLKSRDLEILFPAFSKSYLWFTHIVNYLLRTLS